MRHFLLIGLIMLGIGSVHAQKASMNALNLIWTDYKQPDTLRMDALHQMIDQLYPADPDSAIGAATQLMNLAYQKGNHKYYQEGLLWLIEAHYGKGEYATTLPFCEKLQLHAQAANDTPLLARTYDQYTMVHMRLGTYIEAADYQFKAIELLGNYSDRSYLATAYSNIGTTLRNLQDMELALAYMKKALVIREELGDPVALSRSYYALGLLYSSQEDHEKALDYLKQCATIREKGSNKRSYGDCLVPLAVAYRETGNPDKAIELINESLEIWDELEHRLGKAHSLNILGATYQTLGDTGKALDLLRKAKYIRAEYGDKYGLVVSHIAISKLLNSQGDYHGGLQESTQAFNIARSEGLDPELEESSALVAASYHGLRDYEKESTFLKKHLAYQQEREAQEQERELSRLNLQHAFTLRMRQDSIANVQTQQLKDTQIEAQQAVMDKERIQRYALYGGLAFLLVFAGFLYNRFKVTHSQKKTIERQKELVEHKSNEVLSSILYAQRIQEALLPMKEERERLLPNSFALYLPRDVVSGDFYWVGERNGLVLFTAADGTGHGVPGAFMSVMGIAILDQLVNQRGMSEPSHVLSAARFGIIDGLKQKELGGNRHDSIDMAFCTLNPETRELQYAGAMNPLWIVKKGATEVTEIRADKRPVGLFKGKGLPFTNHTIQLEEGDTIYIFSDGFADQFGGPKGKKFKQKQMRELLATMGEVPIDNQEALLKQTFDNWKGDLDQVDDVCVIGVRV